MWLTISVSLFVLRTTYTFLSTTCLFVEHSLPLFIMLILFRLSPSIPQNSITSDKIHHTSSFWKIHYRLISGWYINSPLLPKSVPILIRVSGNLFFYEFPCPLSFWEYTNLSSSSPLTSTSPRNPIYPGTSVLPILRPRKRLTLPSVSSYNFYTLY